MKKYLFLLFMASLMILSSCHKYEDGPLFSFKTIKTRASHDWMLHEAFKNEADTVTSQLHFGVKFEKNDNVTYTDTVDVNATQLQQISTGTWQFINDGDQIAMILDQPNGNKIQKLYNILRLSDDELWVREQVVNDYYEYHFVPR